MDNLRSAATLGRLLWSGGKSRHELEPIINRRLRIVLEAATSVPYYREIMKRAGYDAVRDYRGPTDLSLFPITRKSDIKAAPRSFLKEGEVSRLSRYFVDRTSGSTGIPLTVYRSPPERAIQIAKWLRVLMMNGYRPTDKLLSYTSPGRLSEGRTVLQRFGLFRRKAINYTLSPAACANALLEYRPEVVYGVRTSLLLVAEELERRGAKAPPIKLLVATGEVIDDKTRRRCRQVLGVDITETYGTVEMGVMAYQRDGEKGLNLIEDCTLFEFLDEKGDPARPGQPARIVVTDLYGCLMPFIRYDQGDLAVYTLRQGPQGETVRVLNHILGRQDDMAPLPDGRWLTYLDFYEIMDLYDRVERFRVKQVTGTSFIIELVVNRNYYQTIQSDLFSRLRTLSPLPLSFELRLVERIDPDPNGKMCILLSEVHG